MSIITYGQQTYGKLAQVDATVVAALEATMARQSMLVGFAHLNQRADQ